MRSLIYFLMLFPLSLSFPTEVLGGDYRPSMHIPSEVEVDAESITIGDIAKLHGNHKEFIELMDEIRSIPLGIQLRPLAHITLPGSTILDTIEKKGIPLDAFGYSIPVEIKITRGGRLIAHEEVLNAARLHLHADPNLEINVKGVEWDSEQLLPNGESRIEVESLGAPDRGKLPIRVSAFSKDQVQSRFLATALVDDWRSVPVIRGRLDRGTVITSSDIQIVRTNLATLPIDVVLSPDEITGRRTTRSLASGNPVRKSDVDFPPIIERGKLVKMIYKSGGLTASATGIALEAGLDEEVIQLRNERSNKLVKGRIINAEEVLVLQ
jgi:flagellar basal body P-ring formation protein FlgA